MTNADQSVTTSTTDRQVVVPAPGRFDAETEARLAGIDRDATKHVQDNRPAKTRNGYAADWRAWEAFCAETDLPPLAVRSGTLVLFTEWCWIQPGYKTGLFMAASTIDRRLAGVVVTGRRQHKLQLAVDVAEEARALLKAKVKAMEKAGEQRGRGQAPALLVRHFAIAGREHEVGWLRERHIAEDPEGRGLIVDVRISKNYPRVVQVPYGSRAHLCPVRAWRRWREEAGLGTAPDGFAYRRLHSRHHTVMDQGLDAESVGDVITRLAERAGLDIRPTGHSPRRGLVTESSRAGNPDAVAEKQGGWAKGSKVMRRYREDDDGFTENALHGVL
ncbi:integrase [Streptomyces scopuliridis]|uniref:integrase n=1 Tax=Streptomyces scopuliridis TaxID=452529 RepID=UPI0036D1BEFB